MELRSPIFANQTRLEMSIKNGCPLTKGDWGDAVLRIQQALIELGFSLPRSTRNGATPPNGLFDHETVARIVDFQRIVGLPPTGSADARTLDRMDMLLWRDTAEVCETIDECTLV